MTKQKFYFDKETMKLTVDTYIGTEFFNAFTGKTQIYWGLLDSIEYDVNTLPKKGE